MVKLFQPQRDLLDHMPLQRSTGRVTDVTGMVIIAEGLPFPVGFVYEVRCRHGQSVHAQSIGLRGDRQILMSLQSAHGISAGDPVISRAGMQHVSVGRQMLGSVLDGMGQSIDKDNSYIVQDYVPIERMGPPALTREPIETVLTTGVRSIDAMHTIGAGQRMGIFAGTGVGKSVLMGMITRNTSADVNVVALVGERGREVGEFLRKSLTPSEMQRSVLVVSTSNESPVLRVRAAFVATAIAEFFRDLGNDVLLIVDSVTRIAMAQREIGLAAGEPPTTKGYPPSVPSLLARLLERSGRTAAGSITGVYTVLVEGDDINEPVSDTVRGILDGHLWLSRDLANRGHYPAVDVLQSISRVMPDVVGEEHRRAAHEVRRVLAVWADIEDLVNIGAYTVGTNPEFDVAVRMKPEIDDFLQQGVDDTSDSAETVKALIELSRRITELRNTLTAAKRGDTGAANAK